MRFPDSFLDEIRDRVPISSVIGAARVVGPEEDQCAARRLLGLLPVPRREEPVLPLRGQEGPLPLFRLRRVGRPFPLPDRARRHELSRKPSSASPSMAGVPMPERDPEAEKRDQQRASLTDVMELATKFFQEQLQSAVGAKARAYLRDRGLSSATQQSFRLGYAPDSRNALKEFLAAKGITKAQMEACGLTYFGDDIPVSYRPLPRPRDVPDPGFAGPHHRLRRPRADVRRAGQISELAGDRALPQGQRALQFRARPQGHAEGRHGDRRRGLYGRDRAGPGRLRERRRAARHRAHREPARAVVAHVGRAGAVLRRRPGRAEGGVAGRRHGAAADPGRAARCASRCCRRARTPTTWSRPTGRTPSARCSPRRGRSPTCCGCARPRAACSTRRSGGPSWKRRCASSPRRIRDESVRYHYQQEMRDRVHAFFGAQRGRPFDKPATARRARQRGRGRADNGRAAARRRAASPSRKAWRARRWSSAPAA